MNKTLLFSLLLLSSLSYIQAKPHFGFGINFDYPLCAPAYPTLIERPVYAAVEEIIDEHGRIIVRRPIRRHYRVIRRPIMRHCYRPAVNFGFGLSNWL